MNTTNISDITESQIRATGPVFSYKLRYIVGFGLVEMAISTNPKPTIYRQSDMRQAGNYLRTQGTVIKLFPDRFYLSVGNKSYKLSIR